MAEQEAVASNDTGWDDISHNLPSGEPSKPKPKTVAKQQVQVEAQEPSEPATAVSPEPVPAEVIAPAVETGEASAAAPPAATTVKKFKLDGKEYELGAVDEQMLDKLFTRANQQPHFQKLSEERQELARQAVERAQMLESAFTQMQMQQQAASIQQQQLQQQMQQQQQPTRPDPSVLMSHYKPYIEEMQKQGRISEYDATDHSGMIAEYLFDYEQNQSVFNQTVSTLHARIQTLEQLIASRAHTEGAQQRESLKARVRNDLVNRGDYFAPLKDDNNWNQLLARVTEKMRASGGSYDPEFTAAAMADEWIAMNAPMFMTAVQKLKEMEANQSALQQRRVPGDGVTGSTPGKSSKPPGAGAVEGWGDLTGG